MKPFLFVNALLALLLNSTSLHSAEPVPVIEIESKETPTPKNHEAVPTYVSPLALKAILANKNTVTIQLSEEEAIALAASRGIILKPRAKNDPSYGHPWVIVKLGIGAPSMFNVMIEVFVNDAWSLQPHVNLGLIYSAALVEARYHPEKFCWNCRERLQFALVPGFEAGYRSNTDGYTDGRSGVMIVSALDGEITYRLMEKGGVIKAGLRLSGGIFIENSYYTGTIQEPVNTQAAFDALLYVGIGL